MIEICFNELTVSPLCENLTEIEERVNTYVNLLMRIQSYFGSKTKIRYEYGLEDVFLTKELSLASFCFAHLQEAKWRNKCQLLLAMSRKPYISNGNENSSGFYDYDDVAVDINGKKKNCMGLFCTFLYHSFAVGFASDSFWTNRFLFALVLKPKAKGNVAQPCRSENVYSISDEKHLEVEDFVDWVVANHPIPLHATDLLPTSKNCHLRDDHGNDVIEKYFNRLRNCEYVVRCINSLPWNPTCKKMIRNVSPNGQIEIVLTNTDKGLGLVIETTASNIYQGKAIAKYIEENYKC